MNTHFRGDALETPLKFAKRCSPVLALHCSGSDNSQWRGLQPKIEPMSFFAAPNLLGTHARGFERALRSFRLSEEAEHIIPLLENLGEPAHLVGHSYGGALALHIARHRPDLVRSLCVYEPTLFSILEAGNLRDLALLREIEALARTIRNGVEDGYSEFSAQVFTDFWGGLGAWQALSRERREALTRWIGKAPLDFDALLNEPEPTRILVPSIPISLMMGSSTHEHTARIVTKLRDQRAPINLRTLEGAGHLGPFTFRNQFEMSVLDHIREAELARN